MTVPATLDVPTSDSPLRVLRWGDGPNLAVAVHGITSSAMAWAAVGERTPAGWSLVAPDLRGRGHSSGLPGPYGFAAHIADLAALLRRLGGRPVLAGHSMGAYVALLTRDTHPELVSRLVLLDGGLPLPAPPEAELDATLDATLGPAIARLSQTFPTADSYVAFWRAHPAFASGWNAHADAYARYDLTEADGGLRSRVVAAAARADGRDLLTSGPRFSAALDRLAEPTSLLTAPAGLFGEPPGLLPPDLIEHWRARVGALRPRLVPGLNHYTMLFAPDGVEAVAGAVFAPAQATAPS